MLQVEHNQNKSKNEPHTKKKLLRAEPLNSKRDCIVCTESQNENE